MAIKVTKPEFESLPGKMRWDILVALRGPDCCHSDAIKWFTVAPIRARVGGALREGGSYLSNPDLGLVVIGSRDLYSSTISRTPSASLRFDAEHFLCHVSAAAQSIGLPIFRLPAPDWMLAASTFLRPLDLGREFLRLAENFPTYNNPSLLVELKRHLGTLS